MLLKQEMDFEEKEGRNVPSFHYSLGLVTAVIRYDMATF